MNGAFFSGQLSFYSSDLQMSHSEDPRVRHAHTLRALDGLAQAGALSEAQRSSLRQAYLFIRELNQALALLDPGRRSLLDLGGPLATAAARRLGLRERDGHDPAQVLAASYRRHARTVRSLFEALVAPIGDQPPW